jgi:hypothetical protein
MACYKPWVCFLVMSNNCSFPIELSWAMSCLLAYKSYVQHRHLRDDQVTPTLAKLRRRQVEPEIVKTENFMLNVFRRRLCFSRRCQNLHHVTGDSEGHGLLGPWKTQLSSCSLIPLCLGCPHASAEGREEGEIKSVQRLKGLSRKRGESCKHRQSVRLTWRDHLWFEISAERSNILCKDQELGLCSKSLAWQIQGQSSFNVILLSSVRTPWPPLWFSGQSSWIQIRRPRFDSRHYQKKSSGSGTGSTQPREYNWGATW